MSGFKDDIFRGARSLPTFNDLTKVARSRGISWRDTKGKKKEELSNLLNIPLIYNPNKTPAQAFTPPANEKKMGTIWIFVYYAVYGSGRGRCRDFLVLMYGVIFPPKFKFHIRNIIVCIRNIIVGIRNIIVHIRNIIVRIRNIIVHIRNIIVCIRSIIVRIRNIIVHIRNIIVLIRSIIVRIRNIIFRIRNINIRFPFEH